MDKPKPKTIKREEALKIVALLTGGQFFQKTCLAPFERIQYLLQCEKEIIRNGRLPSAHAYRTVIGCLQHTVKNEGMLPLFRGNVASLIPIGVMYPMTMVAHRTIQIEGLQIRPGDSYAIIFTKNVLFGGIIGLLTNVFFYHLEYVRTRLACDVKSSDGKRQFTGILDVYRKTLHSDGPVGLYRGVVIYSVGFTIHRALFFGLNDTLYPYLSATNDLSIIATASYGITLASMFMTYPFHTIRRRMMMRSCEAQKYSGSFECLKYVLQNEGLTSLWRGVVPSVIGALSSGACLVAYNMMFLDKYQEKSYN